MRHGRVYAGKKGWTLPYRRWLTTVRFDHPAQQVVLQDYIHSVHDDEERIARLTKQIEETRSPNWSMAPIVEAFQAMRGVAFVAAVTVVAEGGFHALRQSTASPVEELNKYLDQNKDTINTELGNIAKSLGEAAHGWMIVRHIDWTAAEHGAKNCGPGRASC